VLRWADYVPQETLFWRRRIWEKVGGAMDESFQYALDWDLLLRFQAAGAVFVRLPRFLGALRLHPLQKMSARLATVGEAENQRLRQRCHGRSIFEGDIGPAIRRFLRRHVFYNVLYRLGVLSY
jgi:hypothetical protein